MDEISQKQFQQDIIRLGGKLPKHQYFDPHTVPGQFNLLVALMMVFFFVAIASSMVQGDYETARALAAEAFRDFFLVAIGLFRGMAPQPKE